MMSFLLMYMVHLASRLKNGAVLIISLLLSSMLVRGQSNDQNYILTHTMLDETGSVYIDKIDYYDGLGRPMQSVLKTASPTQKYIVSLQEYDGAGRQSMVLGTSYANTLINDLTSQTGLTYSISNGGVLTYATDGSGNAIITTDANGKQLGSAIARNHMMSAIGHAIVPFNSMSNSVLSNGLNVYPTSPGGIIQHQYIKFPR